MLSAVSRERQIVADACDLARREGVQPGMTLAHARALVDPERIIARDVDTSRDRAALKALAQWIMRRYSPVVAIDTDSYGLNIDITGCQRLFRGDVTLMTQLATDVLRMGFNMRLAVAPTLGAAWAIARYGAYPREPRPTSSNPVVALAATRTRTNQVAPPRDLLPGGQVREPDAIRVSLEPLPVEGLRLEPEVIEAFDEVGVETIEHVLRLPRGSIVPRFGATVLHRLDQAMGRTPELVEPEDFFEHPATNRIFDGPVTQIEAIEITVRELLEKLCEHLHRLGVGAWKADVRCRCVDLAPSTTTITLSSPSRDPKHLWTLLAPKLESLHLGHGAEEVVVTASQTARIAQTQIAPNWAPSEGTSSTSSGHDQAFGALLDTFASRLGHESVRHAKDVHTHVPEHAHVFAVYEAVSGQRRGDGEMTAPDRVSLSHDRPSILWSNPEPIRVMAKLSDDDPSSIPVQWRWRGESSAIIVSIGPERIAGPWWQNSTPAPLAREQPGPDEPGRGGRRPKKGFRPPKSGPYRGLFKMGAKVIEALSLATPPPELAAVTEPPDSFPRDYFRICDERGRWLWIFRHVQTDRWFLHGQWG